MKWLFLDKSGESVFDQKLIFAPICNCLGVLAIVEITPAVARPIVVPGVPRI
jgi:hypothetical protein